jgi:LuxR family transcriptional regulator, quorum-sensing system regulator SdiA
MARQRRNDLTEREREVLHLVSEGKSSKAIAKLLGCTKRSVDGCMAAASRKLKALNRVHAIAIALRKGLIE